MRVIWAVALVVACKKNEPPPPPAPPPPAVAVVADAAAPAADAASGLIALSRAVPMTITVSSTVRNTSILPRHLVDGNLDTAWNSATGQLIGAWLAFQVPPGATVEEVRMTVGHTGHGPKGEDYFTMNPRIQRVAVTADGASVGEFPLDIARRDLQVLKVHARQAVRLEITAIEPGSKPSWKEVAISELEVWGTPPPAFRSPLHPLVATVVVDTPDDADPCAGIDAARDAFAKDHANDHYDGPGGEDHSYPPACEDLDVPSAPEPWDHGIAWCDINDEIYGPKTCTLRFKHAGEFATIVVESAAAHADIKITSLAPTGDNLAVTWTTDHGPRTAMCHAHPLVCAPPPPAP